MVKRTHFIQTECVGLSAAIKYERNLSQLIKIIICRRRQIWHVYCSTCTPVCHIFIMVLVVSRVVYLKCWNSLRILSLNCWRFGVFLLVVCFRRHFSPTTICMSFWLETSLKKPIQHTLQILNPFCNFAFFLFYLSFVLSFFLSCLFAAHSLHSHTEHNHFFAPNNISNEKKKKILTYRQISSLTACSLFFKRLFVYFCRCSFAVVSFYALRMVEKNLTYNSYPWAM